MNILRFFSYTCLYACGITFDLERAQWLSGRVLDIYPRLVLVQPRKTSPCLTDCRLDIKNQIKQNN